MEHRESIHDRLPQAPLHAQIGQARARRLAGQSAAEVAGVPLQLQAARQKVVGKHRHPWLVAELKRP
jgi:hypothetical protein